MILYVIYQLVCVIDSWAHTSFMHSILSLKLGVTTFHTCSLMVLEPKLTAVAWRAQKSWSSGVEDR